MGEEIQMSLIHCTRNVKQFYYDPGGCLGTQYFTHQQTVIIIVQEKTTNAATQITVCKEMSLFLFSPGYCTHTVLGKAGGTRLGLHDHLNSAPDTLI